MSVVDQSKCFCQSTICTHWSSIQQASLKRYGHRFPRCLKIGTERDGREEGDIALQYGQLHNQRALTEEATHIKFLLGAIGMPFHCGIGSMVLRLNHIDAILHIALRLSLRFSHGGSAAPDLGHSAQRMERKARSDLREKGSTPQSVGNKNLGAP